MMSVFKNSLAINSAHSKPVSEIMADNSIDQFTLERAITLRWTLRDIKGKRLTLSPVGAAELRALIKRPHLRGWVN
jgi:hypothetical protein